MADPEQTRVGRGLPGWVVAVSWCATIVLFSIVLGGWLDQKFAGIDLSRVPRWPVQLSLAAVLVSLLLSVTWALRSPRFATTGDRSSWRAGRRRVLAAGAVGAAGLFATGLATLVGETTR